MEHDDDVKRLPGDAESEHVVPTKFEPEATTAVPARPDAGLKVRNGSTITVNWRVTVSGASVSTITLYVPAAALVATVNPAVNVPAEIAHDGELRRPDGVDERVHSVPA